MRDGRLNLPNTDLDTGRPTARGEYSLADETYDELLDKLAESKFADVRSSLSANLVSYYDGAKPPLAATADDQKRLAKTREHVTWLKAACSCR